MADSERAIGDLSRRVDAVEDLLRVMRRASPTRSNVIISDQGQSGTSLSLGPIHTVRVSVDHSTNDTYRALQAVHDIVQSAANVRSDDWHLSTSQAFDNLRGGSADFTMIVGHGKPGQISTGSGEDISGNTTSMSLPNEADWKSCVKSLPGTRLILFGCWVGASTQGAAFLQRVSVLSGRDVCGWTGAPYVGRDGNLHGEGTFLVAHPTGPPLQPVEPPDEYGERHEIKTLKLRAPHGYDDVPIKQVVSVNFTPFDGGNELPKAFTLNPPEAYGLLNLIDFTNPVEMPGNLLAIRTGQLTLTIHSERGPECRAFYLLGYWLVQDAVYMDTYYHASRDLLKALQGK